MKKTSITIFLLAFSLKLLSQQTEAPLKIDYLEKSKKQKSTAWVLLAGGFLTIGVTAAANSGVCVGPNCTKKDFPVAPVVIGGLAMVSSVPLFIAASKNKRKAASISLKREETLLLEKNGLATRSIPALNFKFSF